MKPVVLARSQEKREWSFFATMSLVVALVIVAGFGPTYAASLAPPGLPAWVHLHGAVMRSRMRLRTAGTSATETAGENK
jgi:hypothetical protein